MDLGPTVWAQWPILSSVSGPALLKIGPRSRCFKLLLDHFQGKLAFFKQHIKNLDLPFSVLSKKLGSKFWALTKVLWFCSYLVCKNNSRKEFITSNMSKIGAFLTRSKNLGLGPNFQKCSDFAHIWCDEFFSWVVFTHQIWAKSEHFWQCPKFWSQFFWQYGKRLVQIFDMLLEKC